MKSQIKDIVVRYGVMIVLALLIPFYQLVLLPLTLYPTYFLLDLFYEVTLISNSFIIEQFKIEIIPACVGVSAFFLLFILNFATPSIKWKKRIKLFLFSAGLFLLFNWLRIFLLSVLFISGFVLFDQIHLFTWYFVSTIAVIAIWFISIKTFKIKKAPFLSDIKEVYNT
ncbi:pacearchaeosortase [Nanoarchaeota archaeon]